MSVLLAMAMAVAGVREHRGADRPLPADVPSILSEDGRFRLHWSEEPALAPEGAGAGATPPGAFEIFAAIAAAEEQYRLRGYKPVVGDDGTGGDTALDLYWLPINANGYAYPLRGQAPDGGNACYIEIDSGLRGDILASVAQHELHHCVQFRYTARTAGWIYEASATWEQYLLAEDSLDLGLQLLYAARLSEPYRPLNDRGDRYEYAGLLVFKHLEQYRRASPRSVEVWRALALDPSWQAALDRVVDDAFELSLAEWFAVYSTDNVFACGLAGDEPDEDDPLPCTTPAGVPLTPVEDDVPFSVDLPETPFASAAYTLPADGSFDDVVLTCGEPVSGAWTATVTPVSAEGVRQTTVRSSVLQTGGTLRWTGDVPPDGTVRVVVASVGEDGLDLSCTLTHQNSLDPEGAGCQAVSPHPLGWLTLGSGLMILGRPGRRRRRSP